MIEQRSTITDKETLKITINQVEMNYFPRKHQSLSIEGGQDPAEELMRKEKLLQQRMKILQKTTVKMWRKLFPVFNIIAILSLSGMQLGYGLIQITTVYDIGIVLEAFKFGHPLGLSLGAMVAFMPLGAFFGSIFGKCIANTLPIKMSHHLNNFLCMLSSFCFMQINYQWSLLLGRFLYGWCIACYCAWSPKYIQDVAPANLRDFTRSIYSLWVMGAMMLGYFFGLIFYQNNVQDYYRVMFCFPGILALIQMIMMIIFVPNSPSELFQRQLYDQGRMILQGIYNQQFVDMMVDRYKLQAEVKALRKTTYIDQDRMPYPRGKFRARFMGIYLNIFRQFVGINSILIYAGLIIGELNYSMGAYTNFLLAILGFVATVASHYLIIDRCGRRFIMLISAAVFCLCNIVIFVGMLVSNSTMILVAMILEILFFGLTYSTMSSIYPAQILKNQRVHYTSLTSWPALILVTLLPPVVADVVSPTHTPWPVFLFYAVYSLFSVFYLWFCAVESKDKQYYDIIKQF